MSCGRNCTRYESETAGGCLSCGEEVEADGTCCSPRVVERNHSGEHKAKVCRKKRGEEVVQVDSSSVLQVVEKECKRNYVDENQDSAHRAPSEEQLSCEIL